MDPARRILHSSEDLREAITVQAIHSSPPRTVEKTAGEGEFEYRDQSSAGPTERYFKAVKLGQESIVKDLLESHPELLNAVNMFGCTGVMIAMQFGHRHLVNMFLSLPPRPAPLDLHFQSPKGVSLIILACLYGSVDIVTRLVEEFRVKVNSRPASGLYFPGPIDRILPFCDPLSIACINDREDLIEFFLKHQSYGSLEDIQSRHFDFVTIPVSLSGSGGSEGPLVWSSVHSGRGLTPLMLAYHFGSVRVANILAQKKNHKVRDEFGYTSGHHLLRSSGPRDEASIVWLRTQERPSSHHNLDKRLLMIFHFLEHFETGDVEEAAFDRQGYSLLHIAVDHRSVPLAEYLLRRGHPCDAQLIESENERSFRLQPAAGNNNQGQRMNRGYTPLHLALHVKHPGLVTLLLQHGARLEARDAAGTTCRDLLLKINPSHKVYLAASPFLLLPSHSKGDDQEKKEKEKENKLNRIRQLPALLTSEEDQNMTLSRADHES